MSIVYLGDDAETTVLTVRTLAADLTRIKAKGCPSPADLARAPLLDCWRLAGREMPGLVGIAHHHPTVRNGKTAVTSALLVLDAEAGWARTWSRYYRLGRRGDLLSGRSK